MSVNPNWILSKERGIKTINYLFKMKMTNFYVPLKTRALAFQKLNMQTQKRAVEELKIEIYQEHELIPSGMASCATTNENYQLLLERLAITDLSNAYIQQYISEKFDMKLDNTEPNDTLFQEDSRFDKFSKSMMHEVFLLIKHMQYTIKSVWAMYNIERRDVHRIIKEYQDNTKRDEIAYNFEARAPTSKVTREHIKFVKDYIRRWKGQHFTVAMVKNQIYNNTDLDNLSEWHIRKILKTYLNYSYKKLSKMNIKVMRPEYIRRFHESAIMQHMLLEVNYELIYLDEFSFSSRDNIFYGWGKKGVSSFIVENPNSFSVSFAIAFSDRHFYGALGWKEAFTSSKFWIFLKELIRSRTNFFGISSSKFWIICDNATIHTSDEVAEVLDKMKISMVTINPYSPSLNPWEILISAIKAKLRRHIKKGGELNLRWIKKALDDVAILPLNKFIQASFSETIEKLRWINSYRD